MADPHQLEQNKTMNTLARIYKDPAPTLYHDNNLSVRSGIEKCPITDFPQMFNRVPKNILGKVNNYLFYKLQQYVK